jgi:hypothetical protein
MGLTPPEQLNQPICSVAAQPEPDRVTQPLALLTPTIDGLETDFFEWRGAGSIKTQPPLSAMWKADGIFTAIQFGWSHDHLYLRFDPDETSKARQNSLVTDITLRAPQRTFRLTFTLAPSGPQQFTLFQATGPDAWEEIGLYRSISRRAVLEAALPWKDLHLEEGQEIQMSIAVLEHGLEVARYPHQSPALLTVPGPEFDAAMWRV